MDGRSRTMVFKGSLRLQISNKGHKIRNRFLHRCRTGVAPSGCASIFGIHRKHDPTFQKEIDRADIKPEDGCRMGFSGLDLRGGDHYNAAGGEIKKTGFEPVF